MLYMIFEEIQQCLSVCPTSRCPWHSWLTNVFLILACYDIIFKKIKGLLLHAGQVTVGHGGAGQVRPLDDGAQGEDFWKLLDENACVNEKWFLNRVPPEKKNILVQFCVSWPHHPVDCCCNCSFHQVPLFQEFWQGQSQQGEGFEVRPQPFPTGCFLL